MVRFFFMRKSITVVFNALTSLSFNKLLKLGKLVLSHPFFAIFSFYATMKAFTIAKEKFPKTNSNNGIGNAFRHALWCCLIISYCCKISSPKKAIKWAKQMTDMHEELFPNQPLETKMDLHNNKIGIQLFQQMLPGIHRQFFETSFFIDQLMEMVKDAEVLTDLDKDYGNLLIYLND